MLDYLLLLLLDGLLQMFHHLLLLFLLSLFRDVLLSFYFHLMMFHLLLYFHHLLLLNQGEILNHVDGIGRFEHAEFAVPHEVVGIDAFHGFVDERRVSHLEQQVVLSGLVLIIQ